MTVLDRVSGFATRCQTLAAITPRYTIGEQGSVHAFHGHDDSSGDLRQMSWKKAKSIQSRENFLLLKVKITMLFALSDLSSKLAKGAK